MRRTVVAFMLLVLSTLLLSACVSSGNTSTSSPPKLEVAELVFDLDDPVAPMVRGWASNVGGSAQYVELAFKITAPEDENIIYMSGWTNFTNFKRGEKRAFSIVLIGQPPEGDYSYHWRTSTTPGGAAY